MQPLSASNLQSHELFVKAAWDSKPIALSDLPNLTFNVDIKYAVDLADLTIGMRTIFLLLLERTVRLIGELYSARDGGIFTASSALMLQLLKQINVSLRV